MGQHTHTTCDGPPIPFSYLSFSYWQAVAHIFISCQIRVCSSWETTCVQ